MTCPWCDFDGSPRELHGHLTADHLERVEVAVRKERRYYRIECPVCGSSYEKEIKPRYSDPRFLEEYRREISLVGFDMLINHLMAEHEQL